MKKERIWAGKEINTPEGYAVVKGYNGCIVFVEEYIIDEEGNERKGDTRFWTLNEIAHIVGKIGWKNTFVVRAMKNLTKQATFNVR